MALLWRSRWRWKLRLGQMLDRPLEKDQNALLQATMKDPQNPIAVSAAMDIVLEREDLVAAQQLAAAFQKVSKREPVPGFNQAAITLELLELYQGKGNIMPFLWAEPEGNGARVNWEFGPNTLPFNPLHDTEVRGLPTPALDGKYDLEIYALSGASTGRDFSKKDLVVRLPAAKSTGSWSGTLPADRPWLVGVLRDRQGAFFKSSPVPAAFGKNLLSPLKVDQLQAKTGPWRSPLKWFWGSALSDDFQKEANFLSRLQAGSGTMEIDHAPVPIDPESNYVFTAWLKTDNGKAELEGYTYPADAYAGVIFLDDQGEIVGELGMSPSTGGRWTLISALFGPENGQTTQAIPPTATQAKIRLLVRTQCEIGEVAFCQLPES